jgi:hypothetical protein
MVPEITSHRAFLGEGMVKDGEAASLLDVGFFEADRHRVDMS